MTDAIPELVRACGFDELAEGATLLVTVRQREVALVRIGDDVFALQDACPHKGGPLCEGTVSVQRGELICPWHRFRFDLRSGASVTNPQLVAKTFPVEVRENGVFIRLEI